VDLFDSFRDFQPIMAPYKSFSWEFGILIKIDHFLGHKINLKNLKELK
jgi:hypothetical protein